jgi:Domain of unknown function (DUF4476)
MANFVISLTHPVERGITMKQHIFWRTRVSVLVGVFVASAAQAQPAGSLVSFHSHRCVANIGKAGVADCAEQFNVTLEPVGDSRVLIRAQGAQCLFSNRDGRFAWFACTPGYEDQHWHILPLAKTTPPELKNGDWRMLRSVHSGKCLFSNQDGRFGLYTCTPSITDQYWRHDETSPHPAARPAFKAPMSDDAFERLVAAVKAGSFSAVQLGALEVGARGQSFSVAQVNAMVDELSFSADKLAALKIMRGGIVDRENQVQILEHFELGPEKAEAQKLLAK